MESDPTWDPHFIVLLQSSQVPTARCLWFIKNGLPTYWNNWTVPTQSGSDRRWVRYSQTIENWNDFGPLTDFSSIVAVHGLRGDAIRTWTHEKTGICWLRDLLPTEIPNARVLSWGYLANTNSWGGKITTSDRILHHAETLIEELQIDREVSSGSFSLMIFGFCAQHRAHTQYLPLLPWREALQSMTRH